MIVAKKLIYNGRVGSCDEFFLRPELTFEVSKHQNEFRVKSPKKNISFEYKREEKGVEYSVKIREREENLLATQSLNMPSTSAAQDNTMSGDDGEDDEFIRFAKEDEDPELPELDVYSRYNFGIKPQNLAILGKRKEILAKIRENSVLVLTASTGTGKSSQVPQYILEEARQRGSDCNIIITQPRRIAGEIKQFLLIFLS